MTRAARRRRITIVTAGHLSTCPRMIKAADALHGDGYDVQVVATRHEPWATKTDEDVRSRRSWPVDTIDYRRGRGRTYWITGIRHRCARAAANLFGASHVPFRVATRAYSRAHSEIAMAAARHRADLIYGGTTGALAAVAEAAGRLGIPYALDLEDLHNGETDGGDAALVDSLAGRIEEAVIAQASFVTTSSEPIAGEYEKRYGVRPGVIHNTFPMPAEKPEFGRRDPAMLRVYWFSQTIGPGRGLEDAVVALGLTGRPAQLTLRGRGIPGYVESLLALTSQRASLVTLRHEQPAPPDTMVDLARAHDVGLALEQPRTLSHRLCQSNKAFTYVLAGVPIAMTDTPGQHLLGVDLGAGAALVSPGDVDALSRVFAGWMEHPLALEAAKRAAWDSAVRRWHWEHDAERGQLRRLVRSVLS